MHQTLFPLINKVNELILIEVFVNPPDLSCHLYLPPPGLPRSLPSGTRLPGRVRLRLRVHLQRPSCGRGCPKLTVPRSR